MSVPAAFTVDDWSLELVVAGSLSETETGNDTFAALGAVIVTGQLSGQEAGQDSVSAIGAVLVAGILEALESGDDTASASGTVLIIGTLSATEVGSDIFRAVSQAPAPPSSQDWSGIAAEVAQGLAEAGYRVTLVEPGAVTGPEWNPTPGAPVETQVTAVEDSLSLRKRDGTTILAGDRLFLVEYIKQPQVGWVLRIDGRDHQIVAVEPLRPGGVDLMYQVQARA